MWINPVTNRTQSDIESETKIAFRDSDTLNRIESNCDYLAEHLGIAITTKKWEYTDFPTESEVSRIVNNVSEIRRVFFDEFSTGWDYVDFLSVPWNEYEKLGLTWSQIEWILKKEYLPDAPTMPFLSFGILNAAETILYYIYYFGGLVWQRTKQKTG